MSELLMLNPRRRRKVKKSGGRRRRRKPAAVAVAVNPRRRRRTHAKRRVRRNPVSMLSANPRRRRRSSRRVARRHYRSNPVPRLTMKGVTDQVMTAGKGAVGALAVDVVMGFIAPRLPVSLLSPNIYPVVKAGTAILLGVAGASAGLGSTAATMANGSLVCTLRDFLRMYMPANLTLGYINSGQVARGSGMGAYVRGVRTPLMGVRTPLMGLGQSQSESEIMMYGPGYVAGGMRGVGAYVGNGHH